MCLHIDKKIDKKVRRLFKNKKYIWAYKEYILENGLNLHSPYRFSIVKITNRINPSGKALKLATVSSSRGDFVELTKREHRTSLVDKGIHLYLYKNDTNYKHSLYKKTGYVVVRAKVYKKDFVAAGLFCGNESLVATKVTIYQCYQR